jgi:hypothetical protein
MIFVPRLCPNFPEIIFIEQLLTPPFPRGSRGGACCVVLFTCGPDCVQHGAWDASAGMHLRLLFLENNREANVVLVFKEK